VGYQRRLFYSKGDDQTTITNKKTIKEESKTVKREGQKEVGGRARKETRASRSEATAVVTRREETGEVMLRGNCPFAFRGLREGDAVAGRRDVFVLKGVADRWLF